MLKKKLSIDCNIVYPEKQTHLAFIEQKADGIVGRNEELEKILRFATNGELDSSFQKIKGKNNIWKCHSV